MFKSVISWLPRTLKRLFLRFFWSKLKHSVAIVNYFSLNILFIVSSSLQETLGRIGTSKYSPTRASTCFLIKGINSTDVGCPIP
jgi:hypothetical protein